MKKKSDTDWNLEVLIKTKNFSLVIFFIFVILISIFLTLKIPIEVMPKENVEPFLFVKLGLSETNTPSLIESQYGIKLEGSLKTLPAITSYNTTISDGSLTAMVYFKPGTDMDLSVLNIEEAISELAATSGLRFSSKYISKFNPDTVSIVKLSFNSKNPKKFRNWLIETLRPNLENISGIAKIDIIGSGASRFEYILPRESLEKYKINPFELASKLAVKNQRDSIGIIDNPSSGRLSLNSKLVEKRLTIIEKLNLSKHGNVTLQQLGNKNKIDSSNEGFDHLNGRQAVFIEVFNKDGADLFKLKKDLNERIKKTSEEYSELQISYSTIHDQTTVLKDSMDNVFHELYGSIIITCLVVFYFLRKFKTTLVLAIGIPLTILISTAILFTMGKTLNILTLSGLILSIGLTVDHEILIAKLIEDLKTKGFSSIEAASRAAQEVVFPLLISTLTAIIIFLPALFVEAGDSFTDLLKIFQIPVFTSLVASFFVSVLFIPVFYILIYRNEDIKINLIKLNSNQNEEKVNKGLYNFFTTIKKNKSLTLFTFLFVVLGSIYFIKDIEETDLESPRDQFIAINFTASSDINDQVKRTAFDDYENFFLENKNKFKIKNITASFSKNSLRNEIILYPLSDNTTDSEWLTLESAIKEDLLLHQKYPGINVFVGNESFNFKYEQKHGVYLQGTRYSFLKDIMDSLIAKIYKIDGILKIKTFDEERSGNEFYFYINSELLTKYKLSLNDILGEFRSQNLQLDSDEVDYQNETYSMRVKIIPTKKISNIEDLNNIFIKTPNGEIVPINSLGSFKMLPAQGSIKRKYGVVDSGFNIYPTNPENLYAIKSKVNKILNEEKFPMGYGLKKDSSTKKFEEMKQKSQFIIGLSILLIYLILASLFESLFIPISILITTPIAIIFGILGLKLLGFNLDPMARLGLLILVGSAVSNAVILIDIILNLKERGYTHDDSIVVGCSLRTSAVLMSTLASILGILPVAIGSQKIMGIPYSTLGICTISGLLFSALLTLIIVPIFYDFSCKLEDWFKEILYSKN